MIEKKRDTFPKWASLTAGPLFIIIGMILSRLGSLISHELSYALYIGFVLLSVYEVVVVIIVNKYANQDNPRKLVNAYLATKVGRIFLALVYAMGYVLIVKEEIKTFVLVFVLIYFIFLLFDTLLLTSWEKNIKKEKERENKEE